MSLPIAAASATRITWWGGWRRSGRCGDPERAAEQRADDGDPEVF
jgi:hypothetical protein